MQETPPGWQASAGLPCFDDLAPPAGQRAHDAAYQLVADGAATLGQYLQRHGFARAGSPCWAGGRIDRLAASGDEKGFGHGDLCNMIICHRAYRDHRETRGFKEYFSVYSVASVAKFIQFRTATLWAAFMATPVWIGARMSASTASSASRQYMTFFMLAP